MREQRTLLNFAILVVVSSATAVFMLNNARKAIAEIDVLNSKPIYIAQRQLFDDDKRADTSNWKTYRSEKYGFEFKYPLEWKEQILNQDIEDVKNKVRFAVSGADFTLIFHEPILPNGRKVTADEYISSYYPDLNKREEKVIDGLSMVRYALVFDARYVFFKDKYIYELIFHGPDSEIEKFDQVVQGFKFIQ